MNIVCISGRLTKDPEIRTANKQDGTQLTIATFTVAVNRPYSRDENNKADFIRCKCFGNKADALEKYMFKGMKIDLNGRIETGSYKDRDGKTVYTTDVIVNDWEFGESKKAATENGTQHTQSTPQNNTQQSASDDNFYSPDAAMMENLPFN